MISLNYSGSHWAKWDLHIHTNASDGKGSPQDIINKAVEKGISVVAITDHHTVKNLDEIKKIGIENNVTVISGIEFRTEYGAKSVHMIGLFPDSYKGIILDQSALEQLILNKLNLSEVFIKAKGREKNTSVSDEKAFKKGIFEVQVDFKKASNLIHKYGGLVSVHAGDKASSIEEMKHNGGADKNVKDVVDSLGTVKDELMKQYIDICELGGIGDKNAQFYLGEFNKPSIVASDAHEINDVGKLFTWIKADKTFEGLKQIIYEPGERVNIQESIPESKSDYQVIESLEIEHNDFGKQMIPFNANMNAIIGGRSSGKSILLGSIAKLCDYEGDIKYNNEIYNSYISKITSCMKLNWRDKSDTGNRKVEYFPQSYINSLASNSNDIINLIEGILKNDEVKKTRFEKYNGEMSKNKIDISNEIETFFKITYKRNEALKEMENIGDKNGISSEIIKLQGEMIKLKESAIVQLSEDDEEKYLKTKEEKATIESRIRDLSITNGQLMNIRSLSIIRNIESELIGLSDELKIYLLNKFNELSIEFGNRWMITVNEKQIEIEKSILEGMNRVEEIKNNEWYCKGEEYYKENATYTELNKRLEIEKNRMEKIDKLEKEMNELSSELYKICNSIIKMQKLYFELGENFCKDILLEKDDVKISPFTKFEEEKFMMSIENNMNRRGTVVSELLSYKYENLESFGVFLEKIFYGLVEGKYTLKTNKDIKQVILDIFLNNYCKVWYDVEYQGDTLSSMSEGKKAFIVLRMLLDFSENICPILIDQPEDDLDNRAIYLDLVTYIKKKKKERQIIVVTHNPNIVVGADSEEIIIANQHGIQNENQDEVKFEYITGSLENSAKPDKLKPILIGQGIREHVCDVLEGGDIAFRKRESKYGL